MKASTIAAVLSSIAALATAAPLTRRAGPSGYVVSPAGGTTYQYDWDAISLDYAPVTFDQTNGQTRTSYIDVTLKCWGGDGEQNYLPLATHLSNSSPVTSGDHIYATFGVEDFGPGFCGECNLVITEHQDGPMDVQPFQAAAPIINLVCYG